MHISSASLGLKVASKEDVLEELSERGGGATHLWTTVGVVVSAAVGCSCCCSAMAVTSSARLPPRLCLLLQICNLVLTMLGEWCPVLWEDWSSVSSCKKVCTCQALLCTAGGGSLLQQASGKEQDTNAGNIGKRNRSSRYHPRGILHIQEGINMVQVTRQKNSPDLKGHLPGLRTLRYVPVFLVMEFPCQLDPILPRESLLRFGRV